MEELDEIDPAPLLMPTVTLYNNNHTDTNGEGRRSSNNKPRQAKPKQIKPKQKKQRKSVKSNDDHHIRVFLPRVAKTNRFYFNMDANPN